MLLRMNASSLAVRFCRGRGPATLLVLLAIALIWHVSTESTYSIPRNTVDTRMYSSDHIKAQRAILEEAKRAQQEYCVHLASADTELEGKDYSIAEGVAKSLIPAGFDIVIHPFSDIVSGKIYSEKGWAPETSHDLMLLLRSYADKYKLRYDETTFVDVGSNLGWFTVLAASAGFNSIAFEAMSRNVALQRRSLCRPINSEASKLVTIVPYGLGSEPTTCKMFVSLSNVGDGHVACGEKIMDSHAKEGYREVEDSKVEIRLMDDILPIDLNIAVMKMDVEGFEGHVLQGGTNSVLQRPIPFIIMEFTQTLIESKGSSPQTIIDAIVDAGYSIRLSTFRAEPFPAHQVRKTIYYPMGADIMLTHWTAESLLQQALQNS